MTVLRHPSLSLLSLTVNGLGALDSDAPYFKGLQEGPCIVLQEAHHASQAQGDLWLKEGTVPSYPWSRRVFWALYTSASWVLIKEDAMDDIKGISCVPLPPGTDHQGLLLRIEPEICDLRCTSCR